MMKHPDCTTLNAFDQVLVVESTALISTIHDFLVKHRKVYRVSGSSKKEKAANRSENRLERLLFFGQSRSSKPSKHSPSTSSDTKSKAASKAGGSKASKTARSWKSILGRQTMVADSEDEGSTVGVGGGPTGPSKAFALLSPARSSELDAQRSKSSKQSGRAGPKNKGAERKWKWSKSTSHEARLTSESADSEGGGETAGDRFMASLLSRHTEMAEFVDDAEAELAGLRASNAGRQQQPSEQVLALVAGEQGGEQSATETETDTENEHALAMRATSMQPEDEDEDEDDEDEEDGDEEMGTDEHDPDAPELMDEDAEDVQLEDARDEEDLVEHILLSSYDPTLRLELLAANSYTILSPNMNLLQVLPLLLCPSFRFRLAASS